MKRRLLSVLLSCCLLLALPMAARANDPVQPTDNQFTVHYDGADGAAVSLSGGATISDSAVQSFETGVELSFTLTLPTNVTSVYRLEVATAGEQAPTVLTQGQTITTGFTHTPATAAPFEVNIWWTQAQFDYDQIQPDEENYVVEFNWDGNGTVTAENATTYRNMSRVRLANATDSLAFTLAPEEGENDLLEVVVGETPYSKQDVTDGSAANCTLDGSTFTLSGLSRENTPRVEFRFTGAGGGEQPEPDPGQAPQPEQPANADPAAAKERIEGRHWAQYGDQAALKGHFVTELWDLLDHEFHGLFADETAVTAAVSVTGAGTATTGSIIEDLPYYEYSIMLKDNGGAGNVVATGKIYRLEQNQDFILAATKGGNTTYTVQSLNTRALPDGSDMSPCVDTAFVVDYDTVTETDGDGRTRAVAKVAFYGIRIEGGTGSTAYSNAFHVSGRNNIGCRVILYKPAFAGAIATANGMEKHAAAWDFGNYPFVCLTGTTQAAPFELTTYFGASSVTLDLPVDDASLALDAITDITTNLPDGAVTIDASTVTFNSGFYDVIPLTVTYADGAASRTGYLTIKRVGIDIQKYGTTHDNQISCTILHGTQNGSTFNWDGDSCAVYATYYYPMESVTQTDRVDLYATYTWANGSVTTRLVSKVAGDDGDSYFLPADDFCLYKGSESAAPTGVAVIAVKSGSTGDKFAGATLGAGAGVAWTA